MGKILNSGVFLKEKLKTRGQNVRKKFDNVGQLSHLPQLSRARCVTKHTDIGTTLEATRTIRAPTDPTTQI